MSKCDYSLHHPKCFRQCCYNLQGKVGWCVWGWGRTFTNVTKHNIEVENVASSVNISESHQIDFHLHRCLFNNKDDRFSDPALLYIHHQTMSFIFTVPIERKVVRLSLKFSLTSQSSDKMWLSTFTQALRLNTILFTCNLLDSFHVLLLWTCTPLYSEGYVIACVRLLVGR